LQNESVPGLRGPRARASSWVGLEERIRKALAIPGRRGVRVIAKQFGVDPGTVQRISRPFVGSASAVVV
jgi:hypothetical protein